MICSCLELVNTELLYSVKVLTNKTMDNPAKTCRYPSWSCSGLHK